MALNLSISNMIAVVALGLGVAAIIMPSWTNTKDLGTAGLWKTKKDGSDAQPLNGEDSKYKAGIALALIGAVVGLGTTLASVFSLVKMSAMMCAILFAVAGACMIAAPLLIGYSEKPAKPKGDDGKVKWSDRIKVAGYLSLGAGVLFMGSAAACMMKK